MVFLEQEFIVRNIQDSPSIYLGLDITIRGESLKISTKTYVTEILKRYKEKYGEFKLCHIPIRPEEHPELDKSPLLHEDGNKHYQHIIGISQWLVTSGRFDIAFAVSSLSRFSCAPRTGHLEMARRIFGYLKKYPSKGYFINPRPLKTPDYEQVKPDFGHQYDYFSEEIDFRSHYLKNFLLPYLQMLIMLTTKLREDLLQESWE
ncbi:MAG: hypothetical protein ACREOZ_02585 [Gloeomargaritales cyanobacterium]